MPNFISPTGTVYGRSLKIGGGGGVPYVMADQAPTENKYKKKLWFCTDKTSERYHTLNLWDTNTQSWIPIVGTFAE